ncbi:MAG TPA: preprotein translocase subunit Sec61beta [Candidatus Thermoplasmatota archaeon]|nr:preprotein translocase subunit Sec61beta [Candidatus Thermoplasmatota archaeon]
MAKEQKGAGFQQAAGLIRYFDAEEETAIHIDPRIVLGLALGTAFLVLFLHWYAPV